MGSTFCITANTSSIISTSNYNIICTIWSSPATSTKINVVKTKSDYIFTSTTAITIYWGCTCTSPTVIYSATTARTAIIFC